MTADNPLHYSRLSSSLPAARALRRPRRAHGALGLIILLGAAAALLSLAVMFLPLSHPRIPASHGTHPARPALLHPPLIPSRG